MDYNLMTSNESTVRELLLYHFQELRYPNPSEAVEFSMSIDGANARFEYLRSCLPHSFFTDKTAVLVSGYSAGSEMLAARRQGFEKIHGTELDPFYIRLCAARFQGLSGLFPMLYSGKDLPYKAESFDLIMSGHIIEHSEDPAFYVNEHLRVLKNEGVFFIEFPSRFHYRELHTSLPSFEWLPKTLRNFLLKLVTSHLSPLRQDVKQRFRSILDTGLKQISVRQLRQWISQCGCQNVKLIHIEKPAPGIVRCLFKK